MWEGGASQRAGEGRPAPEPKWALVQDLTQRAVSQWAPPQTPKPLDPAWAHPGALCGWSLCLTCASPVEWLGTGNVVAFSFIISFFNKRTCLTRGSVLLLSPMVMGAQFHGPGSQAGEAQLSIHLTWRRQGCVFLTPQDRPCVLGA